MHGTNEVWAGRESDVPPPAEYIHFVWKSSGALAAHDIDGIVSGNGWAHRFSMFDANGALVIDAGDYRLYNSSGDDFCSGAVCLVTAVRPATLYQTVSPWHPLAASPKWPLKLRFEYWRTTISPGTMPTGVTVDSSGRPHPIWPEPVVTAVERMLYPNPNAASYFATKLAPIFHHPRCSNCHALGSEEKLRQQHSFVFPGLGVSEQPSVLGGTRLTCNSGCHWAIASPGFVVPGKTFTEVEWMTPKADQGIDWTGKTPKEICETVKHKLSTATRLSGHFFEDARIAWAVNSGWIPQKPNDPPGPRYLETAPPKSYDAFVDVVSRWIRAGAPCPK